MTEINRPDAPDVSSVSQPHPSVSVDVTDRELRPSMTKDLSDRTKRCYDDRLAHYQQWCARERLQAGVDQITTDKVLAYVRAQIQRWNDGEDPDAPESPTYRMFRPETLKQAVYALVYRAEKAGVTPPDVREAREAVRVFKQDFNGKVPPAWRVTGRKSPRRRRDEPIVRPAPPPPPASETGAPSARSVQSDTHGTA